MQAMGVSVREMRAWARATLGVQIVAGRGLTVYPDDTFLVSYPRSGNTWTRFLLGNLLFPDEPTTFLNLERHVPEIYIHTDLALRRAPRPRLLKSHECFEPRYKRVIYVVRDPRDVAVSCYHYGAKKMWFPESYSLAAFLEQWLEGGWWQQFGTWREHVKSWLSVRSGSDGFLLVRYEDIQTNPDKEMERIAVFLGLKRSRDHISRAVDLSSLDRMRALEKKQQKRAPLTKGTRLDKPFVRKAKVGDWRTALPRESVELIEAAWGPLMEELGYPIGEKALNAEPDSPSVVRST